MNFLSKPLLEIDEYGRILNSLKNYTVPINITGPSDSQKVHISYSLSLHSDTKSIFITYNEMQARKIYEDFSYFFGDEAIFFPSREIMLHDVEAKSYDTVYLRLDLLNRIIEGNYRVIVLPVEALVQKLLSPRLFTDSIMEFSVGNRIDLSALPGKLISIGYERVSTVEGRGQFAVRGGIIDIFPVNSPLAVRIELFDDEIDSIREFSIDSQRSTDKLDHVKIIPAREIIYPQEKLEEIIGHIERTLSTHLKNIKKKGTMPIEEKIGNDIDRLRNSYYFPGMDRYITYILDNPSSILEYAGESTVFVDEPSRVKQRVDNLLEEHFEYCKSLMEKGQLLPDSIDMFFNYEDLLRILHNKKTVYLNTFLSDMGRNMELINANVVSKTINSYQGHMELLVEDVKLWKEKKSRVLILSGTKTKGQRLMETLSLNGVESLYSDDWQKEIVPGQVIITHGSLNRGFEYPTIGLVVVSEKEVFGADKKRAKGRSKAKGSKINVFTDLNTGDFVVHQSHGIGQYMGIEQLVVENVRKDYLKIRYNGDGFLYVPTSQLDLIQKYIGSEGKNPKLSKLGGGDWNKTKNKVRESLKEIAGELVELYAKRETLKGFAYSEDTVWQKQFEETFPYEETDDQLKCIEEIKRDMEAEKPMDRLLCGDVGYGKTEVAIRAVFKAVMDGKQVAFLVPTTVLAQQHHQNFKERMKDFPVTVDVISRFRSGSELKKILKDVKTGNIDVLIGTHRLLQKDIQFKDLGLLVVDEEQRFGVTHKEKIKNLKPDVDVLTLTATPIPRTLHMSLVGIRDISVIEDPPEDRYPVQTYVMEYNQEIIRDAINRELARNGQVFYLYNKVGSIHRKASELQALVPDAAVVVGHGQMDEGELEDVMFSFIKGEYNILVCTTIIESGLDMPNVNTIIVEDADKMGLAQLYQLRGRVGRSNRMAFAYITYRKDKVLAEAAEKRLQAIKEYTELGSGFKIAMRDLEIRGAGSLLGQKQHGHMESVGYDMYCRLLDEAVKEIKGEKSEAYEDEIAIDINISAYIDNAYISHEGQKIEMYKKIASIQDESDVLDIEDELIDRFGDIPRPVRNLIQIAFLKTLARNCGFSSIQEKGESVILQYKDNTKVDLSLMGKLMDMYRRKLLFTASSKPYITFIAKGLKKEEIVENIKIMLQDINKLMFEK
jgi:transcription-repair coupling factor (superfamily II helicase)